MPEIETLFKVVLKIGNFLNGKIYEFNIISIYKQRKCKGI